MADPREPTDDLETLDDGEGIETEEAANADEGDDDAEGEGSEDEGEPDGGEEDDAGADEGQEGRSSQVGRQPGRGANRFQTLSREAREAKDRAERAEREIQELKQAQVRREQQENQRLEAERLERMTPEERLSYENQRTRDEFNRQIFALEFRRADDSDRAKFERLCDRNPQIAKLSDEVERTLRAEREQGRNPTRETVAAFLIGRRALDRAGQSATRQRRAAGQERQRQTAKPGSGRGDVQAPNRRSGESDRAARAKRLENMEI